MSEINSLFSFFLIRRHTPFFHCASGQGEPADDDEGRAASRAAQGGCGDEDVQRAAVREPLHHAGFCQPSRQNLRDAHLDRDAALGARRREGGARAVPVARQAAQGGRVRLLRQGAAQGARRARQYGRAPCGRERALRIAPGTRGERARRRQGGESHAATHAFSVGSSVASCVTFVTCVTCVTFVTAHCVHVSERTLLQ